MTIRQPLILDPPRTVWERGDWPPDYVKVLAWRQQQLIMLRRDEELLQGALAYYSDEDHVVDFINHWATTYDPRNAMDEAKLTTMPFILFGRQEDFVWFLMECIRQQQSGLVEKSREMGATWVCIWVSIYLWRFRRGSATGWGSRDQDSVDKIGYPDAIFEKMRRSLGYLPPEFLPRGFSFREHCAFMRIINPENDATITGDCGDNIGRGGRTLWTIVDEAAHLVHPDKAEAALSETTRCRMDVSSVGPLGNVFNRRREAGTDWAPGVQIEKGRVRVFVMDWRDHPEKDQAWYDSKRKRAEDEGLLHVFAREIDRDYAGAVEGVIIPAEWARACVDAHVKLNIDVSGDPWRAALDVADEGGDTNALTLSEGIVLRVVEEWAVRDTGVTTRKVADTCGPLAPIDVQYDAVSVGAGVKAESNRLVDDELMPKNVRFVPWNGGGKVQDPEGFVVQTTKGRDDKESPRWKNFAHNLKAQGWWKLRYRAWVTFKAVTDPAFTWNADDLFSIDSRIPLLQKVIKELSQPTHGLSPNMKMIVNKKPEGTKSPNIGDSIMMNYHPIIVPGIKRIPDAALKWAALAGLARRGIR